MAVIAGLACAFVIGKALPLAMGRHFGSCRAAVRQQQPTA
jgi:hypothetical protein